MSTIRPLPLPDSSSQSQSILDRVFANPLFKNIDRQSLVAQRDTSSGIAPATTALQRAAGRAALATQSKSPFGVLPTLQTSPSIAAIPSGGLLIVAPGTYKLTADLVWAAAPQACAAITILSSDVTLDLGGHTLAATITDHSQYIAGLFVAAASSVTLTNGTLAGMGFYGVAATLTSNLTIKDITVNGLSFNNLTVRNLCPAGIHVDNSQGVWISGCSIQGLDVTSDSSAGLQLYQVKTARVTDCSVSRLVNNDGSVQGFSYLYSTQVQTTGCTAKTLQSFYHGNNETLGHTVLGFIPMLSAGLSFEDCTVEGITGCCDDCHGFSVFMASDVVVSHFSAKDVLDGAPPHNTGAKATGLEVYGANVLITDCTVENIRGIVSQDKQSTGFSAWGVGIHFNACTATNVKVTDPKGAEDPTTLGYGTGFGWAPDPRPGFNAIPAFGAIYNNCAAVNCQAGFDTWFHVDSLWVNPVTQGCTVPILQQPGGQRTLTANACSEVNGGISTTLTNIAKGNTIIPPLQD